jgi:Flp pilus assembly protein TadB
VVSIYLYAGSRRKREGGRTKAIGFRLGRDFIFVWVLLALLIFYIISVSIGSSAIFAAGNIIVEALLILYLVRSRHKSD